MGGVDGVDDEFGAAAAEITIAEASGVLRVANEASLSVLDEQVPLDARAARNIVAHREGPDAVSGTVDDDPFDTLEELDAVSYVGTAALDALLAYAHANDYVAEPASSADGCLILSEYIEGQGNYNKAIELYNRCEVPLSLSSFHVCLVRNDDTTCTFTSALSDVTLEPGHVWTVCRRFSYTSLDPFPQITEHCRQEMPGVMTFSGDDRLVVYRDADGSNSFDASVDVVSDALGRFGYRPPESTWADLSLRRCNFTPADGVSFYRHEDYFTTHARHAFENYGTPPVETCR